MQLRCATHTEQGQRTCSAERQLSSSQQQMRFAMPVQQRQADGRQAVRSTWESDQDVRRPFWDCLWLVVALSLGTENSRGTYKNPSKTIL